MINLHESLLKTPETPTQCFLPEIVDSPFSPSLSGKENAPWHRDLSLCPLSHRTIQMLSVVPELSLRGPAAPSPSPTAVCEMSRYGSTPALLARSRSTGDCGGVCSKHRVQASLPSPLGGKSLLYRRRAVFQHPKSAPHLIDKGANIVSCWGERGCWVCGPLNPAGLLWWLQG